MEDIIIFKNKKEDKKFILFDSNHTPKRGIVLNSKENELCKKYMNDYVPVLLSFFFLPLVITSFFIIKEENIFFIISSYLISVLSFICYSIYLKSLRSINSHDDITIDFLRRNKDKINGSKYEKLVTSYNGFSIILRYCTHLWYELIFSLVFTVIIIIFYAIPVIFYFFYNQVIFNYYLNISVFWILFIIYAIGSIIVLILFYDIFYAIFGIKHIKTTKFLKNLDKIESILNKDAD